MPLQSVRFDDFDTKVLKSPRLVVVAFKNDLFKPWKALQPALEKLATAMSGKAEILTVDMEQDQQLVENNNVDCHPTFIFFKNGKKVDLFSGADAAKLTDKLTKYA